MSTIIESVGPGHERVIAVSKCQIEIRNRLPVYDPSDALSFLVLTGGLFSLVPYSARVTPRWRA